MAKKIMVQGTMSNAGKSLLAAGLCRVFYQDGYRVAPFKSQNMALNSFITEDGLEMGRAQVMQAEAAGIKPEVAMNPILLKPTNDVGSQVIVNGEVLGTMPAMEYYRRKKELIPEILKAFDKLEREYDIIVIEGAGSPAEINLKADDIVNMGMAKMAKAPVLLVGDIDRGGVFAQLVGTMMLLEDEEKRYVKGLVINKFRGDRKILEPGLEMLYDRVQVPIAGVMPYVRLDIDDEDSLTERFRKKGSIGAVDIAVIRLPRISNFTDFNALECMDSVSVRYVERVSELGDPDIIMIPGTKNTIGDLKWLRESGLEARVKQHAAAGKIVFGICGGYQMLGETIRDRYGVEERGEIAGIGLLPIVTEFEEEKTRTRVQGAFGHLSGALAGLSGVPFEGYEIHMGTSTRLAGATSMSELTYRKTPAQTEGEAPAREHREDGTEPVKACKEDGACAGNVYGTYVHGIFDLDGVAGGVVSAVLEQKGMSTETVKNFSRSEYKEHQYDLLADAVRANLDM
ncbi:MAG: cobyric acid synthase, partial [Lachnospiraceae bacterium]|nr:cobyric acid synthase [Lachnospiraceae bacterium]